MAKKKAASGRVAKKKARGKVAAKKKRTAKKAAPKKAAKKRKAPTRKRRTNRVPETSAGTVDSALLRPKPGELIVRMYRQGLGDCFLLAAGNGNSPKYVLIDCGVHMRQTDGNKRLAQVMRQVRDATGGHIHVVVATHEHADHLSGFVQKGTPFLDDKFKIDRLWVSWTEEVGNAQADKLRKKRGTARRIIEEAVKKARDKANASLASLMEDILQFENPAEEAIDDAQSQTVVDKINQLAKSRPGRRAMLSGFVNRFSGAEPLAAASRKKTKPSSNELALGLLALKAQKEEYGEPGSVLKIPGVSDIRAYVLGPPRTEKLLKKDLPTKVRGGHDHEFRETYLAGQSSVRAFLESPALNAGDEEKSEHTVLPSDLRHPFARSYRRMSDEDRPKLIRQEYDKDENSWRTIDTDWLAAGEQLALNLDSDTNNTSLALAFELGTPGEGPVLLFPADAQVGNWLSWRDQTYSVGRKTFSADDLLRRTIVYKVGHHGSHNSTLKKDPRDESVEGGAPFGLELMDDIVAMIPVDRDAANKRMPTPWRMPHQPLYERLREKARRRVLRSDLRIDPLKNEEPDLKPDTAEWQAIPGKVDFEWRASPEAFNDGTKGPLYYDLKIPLPG